jgi:hypothetical protein
MRFELICEDYYPEEHDLHCPGQRKARRKG